MNMSSFSKKWYRSKTIWFNAAAASLLLVEQNLSVLQPLIPLNIYTVATVVIPIVNVWLRVITTKGIK